MHLFAVSHPEDAGKFDFSMPKDDEQPIHGKLHAALIVGFDDRTKTFKVRNSQGEKWGIGGYFTLPYDFVLSTHATDFWTLRPEARE